MHNPRHPSTCICGMYMSPASDLYSMGHGHIEWLTLVGHGSTKETAFRPQPTHIRQTIGDGCADRGSWMGHPLPPGELFSCRAGRTAAHCRGGPSQRWFVFDDDDVYSSGRIFHCSLQLNLKFHSEVLGQFPKIVKQCEKKMREGPQIPPQGSHPFIACVSVSMSLLY